MALTTRTQWASDLLINYISRVVTNLEPKLHFLNFGVRDDVPAGKNTLAVGKPNSFAISDVSTLTEGVNPTAVAWGSSAYTASPTQKGLVVQLSDMLVRNSAVSTISSAAREVRNAVARSLDANAQSTINAGTNVIYAGGKASRAALASGDVATPDLSLRAVTKLDAASVERIGNAFVGISHPNVAGDLKQNSTVGGFLGFYTNPSDVREHKLGLFRGVAYLESGNVQTFSSSVTVYPQTIIGEEAYVWGYYQQPQPVIVTSPDSNNPLNVYQSIGMKASMAITRTQEAKIQRIESSTNQ